MVNQRYWNNNEQDFDRMRRKQAEFLVKTHVPVKCISEIYTYNGDAAKIVHNIVNKKGLAIVVKSNPNNNFYY